MGKTMESLLRVIRARGYRRGIASVGDMELLAMMVGHGNKRSRLSIAGELIEVFGGLGGVAEANVDELMVIEGIGMAGAMRLKATFELGLRSLVETRERTLAEIRSPEDVVFLLAPEMRGLDREHFKAILLNTKNGVLKIITVAIGSLNAALVHPREIFKEAVRTSSAGIIIVHNHPTGNPEPSREDEDLTTRFFRCGELMGIDLVDHIIIGNDCFVSMRERGLIRV